MSETNYDGFLGDRKGRIAEKEAIQTICSSRKFMGRQIQNFSNVQYKFRFEPKDKKVIVPEKNIIQGETNLVIIPEHGSPHIYLYEIIYRNEKKLRYNARKALAVFKFCLVNREMVPSYSPEEEFYSNFNGMLDRIGRHRIKNRNIETYRFIYADQELQRLRIDKLNRGWFSPEAMTQEFFNRYFSF